jgi:hypothetical protein
MMSIILELDAERKRTMAPVDAGPGLVGASLVS